MADPIKISIAGKSAKKKRQPVCEDGSKRINVTFTRDEFNQISNIAYGKGFTLSEQVRQWALQGKNGELNVNNLSIITPIIHEQIDNVISPKMERMIALQVKTCIQAAAGVYLSGEALANFIPEELQQDFKEAYEKARKKAVIYVKTKQELQEGEK